MPSEIAQGLDFLLIVKTVSSCDLWTNKVCLAPFSQCPPSSIARLTARSSWYIHIIVLFCKRMVSRRRSLLHMIWVFHHYTMTKLAPNPESKAYTVLLLQIVVQGLGDEGWVLWTRSFSVHTKQYIAKWVSEYCEEVHLWLISTQVIGNKNMLLGMVVLCGQVWNVKQIVGNGV